MYHTFFHRVSGLSPFLTYKIEGMSMMPTLHNESTVFVSRVAYWFSLPKTGDIVAVKDPRDGKILIKRIKKIEQKKYFLQGDNKDHSTDSRKFGMLEKKDIIGKVVFSFFTNI